MSILQSDMVTLSPLRKALLSLGDQILFRRCLIDFCSIVELAPKSRVQWFVLEFTKFYLVSF